jgi:hypothetical protein
MTTAEPPAETDSRTPAVDPSGATTNAQRAELLRDAATPMGACLGHGPGTAGDSSGIKRTVVTWL